MSRTFDSCWFRREEQQPILAIVSDANQCSHMGSDVDALFKLPLGEFTSARNALVARLKKAGQKAEAAEESALPKPSVSAWVVNQLYWRNRHLFDRLLEAGERLRHAQATHKTGNSAREPVNARREAVAALAGIAADILHEGGYSATRDMMRRVTSSLEALSTYGSVPGAPAAGRLTDHVEPPGFETLTAILPGRIATKRAAGEIVQRVRLLPEVKCAKRRRGVVDAAARRREEQREVAAAKRAVREAERALGVARKNLERAAAQVQAAATRARKSEGQRVKLEKQLARAAKEAEAAHEQARAAQAGAREAMQAAESAERALGLARRQLEQLTSTPN